MSIYPYEIEFFAKKEQVIGFTFLTFFTIISIPVMEG